MHNYRDRGKMDLLQQPSQPAWRRSSRCAGGDCVEIMIAGEEVAMRDSKNPDDAILRFSGAGWQAFVAAVQAGEYDLG
jgi:Domain of unknown function (DUF397)